MPELRRIPRFPYDPHTQTTSDDDDVLLTMSRSVEVLQGWRPSFLRPEERSRRLSLVESLIPGRSSHQEFEETRSLRGPPSRVVGYEIVKEVPQMKSSNINTISGRSLDPWRATLAPGDLI